MAAAACLLAAFCFNAAFFNAPALAQCVGTTSVTCSGTIFNPGGDGFGTGGENGISITVQPGASVTGGVFDGLFIGSDNTVTNFGTIVGQTGYGINASGDLTVFNSGEISGLADDGIIASDIFLTNFSAGVISGSDVGVNGDNVTLTNYGTITGGQIGVQAAAGLASIVNYGTIAGGNSPFFESEIFANRVNVFNAGTISGYIGVMAGLGGGSVLVNAGRIVGTFAAIDFTASGGDTLTFLPGSRLVGSVELGNGNGASTVNIVTGRDVGWLLTFGACGCGGLIENQSIVRFSGGAPAVVSGNQIATLDPTAFGLADRNLVDFTGWISSLFSGRLGETGPANAAFAAYAPPANPASAVARDAFASARPADAQEAPGPGILPNAVAVDPRSGTAVWTKGFAGIRRQDADGPMLAATTTGYGGAFGIDGLAAPDLRVGGFIGAGAGRFGVDRDSQHIETDYVFGGIYDRLDRAAHYLDFAVSAGHSVSDSRRLVANNMAVNGLETALGKYDGWFVSPEVAYGVRVPVGANVTLVPNARVRYVMGHFDGYAETGSAQSLSVGRRDMHDIEERLELALTMYEPLSVGMVKTLAHIGVIGLQRVGDRTVDAILIGQPLSFATPGRDTTFGGYAGLAFDYRMSAKARLFAGLEATVMDDRSRTGTARGGVRFNF